MAIDIDALKTELDSGHPDTGAYNADDALAAVELNTVNRTLNKTSMTSSEVYNAIDVTQWNGLTDPQQQEVWNILHLGEINPFGFEADRFTTIFGGGSATLVTLSALRKTDVSRAVEIGLGEVKVGHVQEARKI